MDVRKLREGILIRLAKDVQAFKSFSGYQFTVEPVASVCRQNEGK